jgi:hypothetical protein
MVDPALTHAPAPFIVGVGRSGTTLLRLMLDAHPELAIPGETHFLADFLGQDVAGLTKDWFFRTVTEAPTWPNLLVDEAAFAEVLDEIEPYSVSEAIRAFYRLYAHRFGKERWGDKTPPYRGHMVGIQRLLPEARFIHLIRDGRDAALSYRGLWFGPGKDIEAQARFWVAEVRSARTQSVELRYYLEIKYETLVSDPETTLRSICDYLGLSYHPRMLDYHLFASSRLAEFKRPFGPPGATPVDDIGKFLAIHDRTRQRPDLSRISRWRNEMPNAEQRRYEAIAGTLLRELGYETRFVQDI